MIETILLIVVAVLLVIVGVFVAILMIRQKKAQKYDGQGLLNSQKQENEKLLLQQKAESDMILKVLQDSNANMMNYVKHYNDSVVKALTDGYHDQKGQIKEVYMLDKNQKKYVKEF